MKDFSCKIVDPTATIVIAMITTVKEPVKNANISLAANLETSLGEAAVFLKEVFQKGALKSYLLLAKKVPAKGVKLIQNFLWLTVLTMEVDLEIIRVIRIIWGTVLHVLVPTMFVPINVPNV